MNSTNSFLIGGYGNSSGTSPNNNFYLNGYIAEIIAFNTVNDSLRYSVNEYLVNKYFPDQNTQVSLGLDIHIPYSFCDTAITTAYNPDFISYQWSSGETDSVIHVNRSGRYTVTVTNSFGVTSTDDINVYFPEVYQMQDTTICARDTIYWNTGLETNGYSFQWFKNGEVCAGNNILALFEEGNYYCIVTDSLGCTFQTETMHLGIDDYPETTTFDYDGNYNGAVMHYGSTELCSGNTIGLTTNINETTSYIWNTGATSSRITITESGDYSLTTTNNRGCHAVNSIHVNILGEAPEINYAIDNLCFGDSTSFIGNAQSQQGIESYLWIIDDTDSISAQSFNYEFANTGNHNIRNIVTSNNSCRADSSFSITIKEVARPGFTFTPVCYGVPMDFIDNSTIPEGTEAESYSWMIEESVIGNEANLTYTFGDASTTLSKRRLKHIINLNNGCSADTTIEINISSDYAEPRYVSCAYPTIGMLVNTDSIRFEWNYDYDILYYYLIISHTADFSSADTIASSSNSINLPTENFADTTYWKVSAFNHCLVSFESEPYFFRKTADGSISISSNPYLQLWLRADSVEITEGKVSRWYDLSPNNYVIQQTTASSRPSVNESAINDNP
ncbi:MAG: hypothetical protein IJK62_14025, partial [Bacteroidales bacterium]|nr:hypothetical protein [Bacteroidales bacterium]